MRVTNHRPLVPVETVASWWRAHSAHNAARPSNADCGASPVPSETATASRAVSAPLGVRMVGRPLAMRGSCVGDDRVGAAVDDGDGDGEPPALPGPVLPRPGGVDGRRGGGGAGVRRPTTGTCSLSRGLAAPASAMSPLALSRTRTARPPEGRQRTSKGGGVRFFFFRCFFFSVGGPNRTSAPVLFFSSTEHTPRHRHAPQEGC